MRGRVAASLAGALWSAAGLISSAWGDTGTELDTIVVTATRIPTPVDQVGSSVTVITAADIEQLAEFFQIPPPGS